MAESADVAITTVTFMLVIVSIVGNTLVCAVIKRNRDMRYIHGHRVQYSAIITCAYEVRRVGVSLCIAQERYIGLQLRLIGLN